MNIIILGKNGQIGSSLFKTFMGETQCRAFDSREANLLDEKKLRKLIREIKPQVIINAAAYTAVDQAEHNEIEVFKLNARGPEILGEEATDIGASVIHFSTDYVFNGKKHTPYLETDKTNPLNVYGAAKLEGEKLLKAACPQSLILRTSWVVSDHGQNFLKTILNLAHEKESLHIVSDQVGAPTSDYFLAGMTKMLVYKLKIEDRNHFPFGLYHLAPRGETNWYDFAKLVIAEAIRLGDAFKVTPDMIHPIKTQDYPSLAKRPLNSRLNTEHFENTFGVTLPRWEDGVFAIMKALYQC